MSKFWSDIVDRLDPYVPGEQPQDQRYIKLNTNESPYPPSPAVAEALADFDCASLRRYPDPESGRLVTALAEYHGLSAQQIFVGNGSDEVLAHAFRDCYKNRYRFCFPISVTAFTRSIARFTRSNSRPLRSTLDLTST